VASSARIERNIMAGEELTKRGRVDDEGPCSTHSKTIPRNNAPPTFEPTQGLRSKRSKVSFLEKKNVRVL
jgi:hypothetical protein